MSTFVGIFGISGVVLIGAITIWASLAGANKPVPLLVKLTSLLGALGLVVGAVTLFAPPSLADDGIPQQPPTPQALPSQPTQPFVSTPGIPVYDLKLENDPSKSWRLKPISKMGSTESMDISNGEMQLDFKSGGGSYVLNLNLDAPELVDSEIEATIERRNGPNTMSYGLMFRSNNESQMYFLINNDQKYGVFMFNAENPAMIDRVPWTYSNAIDSNGPNKMKVIARGKEISIYVNDAQLTTFMVDRAFAGAAGAYVILYEPNESGRLRIANYRVAHAAPR
jgi:hypothetical protein